MKLTIFSYKTGATITTHGGVVAAPMVGEIFEQILHLLNDKKNINKMSN